MKLAIMQPYFFPYLGYFQLINSVDKFILYDNVNYIKKGWINRNYILLNKEKYLLNVPLVKASQNKLICDTLISNQTNWREKMMATIIQAYKKAPYFNDIFPIIEGAVKEDFKIISEFNRYTIEEICHYLGIKTKIEDSSERGLFKDLKGAERIIGICNHEKAEVYINPIGGKELYHKEQFELHTIQIKFLNPNLNPYPQLKHSFVPNLSIIDNLMFIPKEEVQNRLNDFELI